MSSSHFTWFDAAGVSHAHTYVAANITVTALLVVFSLAAKAALGTGEKAVVPAGSLSIKGFSETLVEYIDDLVTSVLGAGTRNYVPLFRFDLFLRYHEQLVRFAPRHDRSNW